MWEFFEPFFEWHYNGWLANTVSGSVWLFPALETVHILAMAMMFGGLFVINLRLLGLGMRQTPVAVISKTMMPYVNWGLINMVWTGYGMFASEAEKAFYNDGFKFKMASFFLAVLFQYTVYRIWIARPDQERSAMLGFMLAFTNFALWACVGAGGRAIGFV